MPLRAISYVMSATKFRNQYLPEAQLQIVHPLNISKAVNGLNEQQLLLQACGLAIYAEEGLHDSSAVHSNAHYLQTSELPSDDFTDAVRDVVSRDGTLSTLFEKKSAAHNADYARYVAAHLLVHDGHGAGLVPLPEYDAHHPVSQAERIISVGAQSERPFHAARMLCRQAGILPDGAVPVTGQMFTKHVLPPYVACRGGEPGLDDFMDLLGEPIEHPVLSVQRDLRYLQVNTISNGEQL